MRDEIKESKGEEKKEEKKRKKERLEERKKEKKTPQRQRYYFLTLPVVKGYIVIRA